MLPPLPYHPVVVLPPTGCPVLDLRQGAPAAALPLPVWALGRYDERRGGNMYSQALFEGVRDVHVGVDLFAPAYTACHAPWHGRVVMAGVNPAPGDYGPVLVVELDLDQGADRLGKCYALFGHLATHSLQLSPVGRVVQPGDVLGWIGVREENGGWDPHVHFQLSWERPATHDLPGVVALPDRSHALARFPDPTPMVLRLYPAMLASPLLGPDRRSRL